MRSPLRFPIDTFLLDREAYFLQRIIEKSKHLKKVSQHCRFQLFLQASLLRLQVMLFIMGCFKRLFTAEFCKEHI